MTARSLFEIVAGTPAKARRSFQPVRRNSYAVGTREARFWRPVNPRHKWAHIRAAEAYDRRLKEPDKRNGPLGHIGLELLRELYRTIDYKSGRLDPSIEYLMRQLRRSRAAVVHALARLKAHGFLNWIRRCEQTGNERGPQIRQVSNAYRLSLPPAARRMVARLVGSGPGPDDDRHRREQERHSYQAMLSTLPPGERVRAIVTDDSLGDVLARLELALENSASSPSGQNPGKVSL